jgi:hypothetical protein
MVMKNYPARGAKNFPIENHLQERPFRPATQKPTWVAEGQPVPQNIPAPQKNTESAPDIRSVGRESCWKRDRALAIETVGAVANAVEPSGCIIPLHQPKVAGRPRAKAQAERARDYRMRKRQKAAAELLPDPEIVTTPIAVTVPTRPLSCHCPSRPAP